MSDIEWEISEAERKAWDALSRYKFWMFGYWAAIWVHLTRVAPAGNLKRSNPWRELVKHARKHRDERFRSEMAATALARPSAPTGATP